MAVRVLYAEEGVDEISGKTLDGGHELQSNLRTRTNTAERMNERQLAASV